MKKIISLKMATMTTLPLPVTLVSTIGKNNTPNIAVVTYITGVNEKPPMFGIAFRPEKYSSSLIRQSKEFVINIPTMKLVKEIDYCGTHTGRKVQKFDQLNLTPIKAKRIKTPLIAECPINIECKLRKVVVLPSHDFFIGEAVAVHVDKDVVDIRKNKFGIFLPKFEKLAFLLTTFLDYRVIGKKIGTAFKEHQKLDLENKIVGKGGTVCR